MSEVPVLYGGPAAANDGEPAGVLVRGGPDDRVRAPAGGEPMLVLRSAAEVRGCLRQPRVVMAPTGARGCPLTGAELQDPDGGLLTMDPPQLLGIRRSISGLFSACAAASLPAATAIAARLAGGLARHDEADLRTGYAEPFTAAAVCQELGRPAGDWDFIHAVSQAAFRVVPPGGLQETRRAWASLYAYYDTDSRYPAATGLIGQITMAMRRDGYSPATIVHTLATVSNGFPAIYPVLARCLAELLRQPTTVARCLRGELDWGATADGLMKTDALFPFTLPRLVLADIDLVGRTVPAGTVLLPSLVAAGRDGAPASIAFGAGPHYCPGASYSRLWITAAIRVFFEAFPRARLADPGHLDWNDASLRVPRALLITLR